MSEKACVQEGAKTVGPMATRDMSAGPDLPPHWSLEHNFQAFLSPEELRDLVRLEQSGSLDFWLEEEDLYGAKET